LKKKENFFADFIEMFAKGLLIVLFSRSLKRPVQCSVQVIIYDNDQNSVSTVVKLLNQI